VLKTKKWNLVQIVVSHFREGKELGKRTKMFSTVHISSLQGITEF
jgi:hypothetical protein